MAAADPDPVKTFEDEASCSICLEYFNDPVTLDCGHNFCRACITQCWERSDPDVSCPQCREIFPQRNLRANRQLGSLIDLIRQVRDEEQAELGGENVCEKHRKALKLYCKQDQSPICVVCDSSREHGTHTVVPIDEAAQEYKEQIWRRLDVLEKEREEILALISCEEEQSQELLRQMDIEREKIEYRFEKLQKFLQEQERLLFTWLEKLAKEVVTRKDENVLRLSEEVSRLNTLISEMEEKCEQPTSEFLQDIRSTLSRCEMGTFQTPAPTSPEPKWRLWLFSQNFTFLQDTLKKLKGSLLPEPEPERAKVTLDPDTANPWLDVSTDRKSVNWGVARQDQPENPERFDPAPCVLAVEGFISGRHYWEVEVGEGAVWVMGVAQEPVKRTGASSFTPEKRTWAVRKYWDQHWALTSPETPLYLHGVPRRIRVYLDYEGGLVAFYDAGTETPIFTFPPSSFAGEKICPFFELLSTSSQITLQP
ncbi:zinc finger protein RFP-like [Emydura macquarii macquarii]|uniref:zinc finger protein RFP-like n=1 Tax=Emydura macquarii macquarii TaxID=1129001 RepID=UPI00352A37AB